MQVDPLDAVHRIQNILQGRVHLGHRPVIVRDFPQVAQEVGVRVQGERSLVDAVQIVGQIDLSLVDQVSILFERLLFDRFLGMDVCDRDGEQQRDGRRQQHKQNQPRTDAAEFHGNTTLSGCVRYVISIFSP